MECDEVISYRDHAFLSFLLWKMPFFPKLPLILQNLFCGYQTAHCKLSYPEMVSDVNQVNFLRYTCPEEDSNKFLYDWTYFP